jgi:hypothetical protein
MKTSRLLIAGIVAAAAMLAVPQHAGAQEPPPDQQQQQQQPEQDPPGRVARMNYTEGSVSFQPGGEGDWLTAVNNRPLTTGDNLWADKDSRAELHVGSTVLRMGEETSMTFLNLDDRATQLRLAQGSLLLRVRHLDDDDDFEVDTPNLAFTVRRPGEYRIDVNDAGDTTLVTVWKGQGEAAGGGANFTVLGGQQSRFTGTDQIDHQIDQLPPDDALDSWASDRDRREDAGVTPNYISPEMTGYEDLDDYGRWNYVAGYGNVWQPTGVAVGWAPYRNGHWAYIGPWGWTWVEDEPWGFAPFHYGRWAYVGAGWCWVPGPVVVRPVYAPALVAWVGGVGIAVGGGGPAVGWFPLAPGEVFVPGYRVSRGYVNQVNVTNTRVNITQVTNVYNNINVTHITYVNQRVANGVTVVSHDTFVNARPVARGVVRVNERELAEAQVVRQSPAEPVRGSVLGAGTTARFKPPAAVERRQVVATRSPAPMRPSFNQRPQNMPRNDAQQNTRPVDAGPNNRPNETQRPNENARPNENTRPAEMARPNQIDRPTDTSRANDNSRPNNNDNSRPNNVEQSQPARNVPRPSVGGGSQPPATQRDPQPGNNMARPAQPTNERAIQQQPGAQRDPQPGNNMSRPAQPTNERAIQQQPWSHPLARPTPPQHEMSQQQAQQEEQKYHNWQQNQPRPTPAPRESPKPAPREAPKSAPPKEAPKSDRPH